MAEDARPNPDALLADIGDAEPSKGGQLRIFLGMCPGVGKTYAMLQAARERKEDGLDVVVGIAETHGRAETAALLKNLEIIPRRRIDYRSTVLEEMDIDGILARRPRLVVVDELAHTNAPESRHAKRYQDVLELLDAGISVYGTLNVQHIESRVEVIRQITGVTVLETVPDSLMDRADEIQLIDLLPEQLRERLAEGKVYLGERADTAAANFFREGNLTALREMALRYTAERVDRQMRDYMRKRRISGPWKPAERLLVGIGASPYSENLIRWTRRTAGSQNATWMAVFVDTGGALVDEEKTRVTHNLSLARQLGAEVLTVADSNVSGALVRIARENNVSQIVVGKPPERKWWQVWQGRTLVDQLLHESGDIDLYVVRPGRSEIRPFSRLLRPPSLQPREFAWAGAVIVGTTLLGEALKVAVGYRSVALFYLGAVVGSALFLSRWPLLMAAALGALAWDFLFVPPHYTFRISEFHDGMMFAMLLVVAIAMGHLTSRLREREQSERDRQRRSAVLLKLTQQCALEPNMEEGLVAALRQIDSLFQATTVLYLRKSDHELAEPHVASSWLPSEKEKSVARWTFDHRQAAGCFTQTLPRAEGFYLPLQTQTSIMGVLGLRADSSRSLELPERELFEAIAAQMALALERDHFREAFQHAQMMEQSEQLRRTLLDNVSHELKTPVAVISTALGALRNHKGASAFGEKMLSEMNQAVGRLQRIVALLVDSARMEAGLVQAQLEWCDVSEVLTTARQTAAPLLKERPVGTRFADEMPFVKIDPHLTSETLAHLLNNAAIHTPSDSPIEIKAGVDGDALVIRVADGGPGLADPSRVFEKFYRGTDTRPGGLGLGLSIARGLIRAQGGDIAARNRETGGAEFEIRIPCAQKSQVML